MYKIFFCLGLLAAIGSCRSGTQTPPDILSKEKMVLLVRDLHLIEAYTNANFPYSDSSKYVYKKLEDSILKTHGATRVAFDSSLAYYRTDIKSLDRIYAAAIDSLSLLEGMAK